MQECTKEVTSGQEIVNTASETFTQIQSDIMTVIEMINTINELV